MKRKQEETKPFKFEFQKVSDVTVSSANFLENMLSMENDISNATFKKVSDKCLLFLVKLI